MCFHFGLSFHAQYTYALIFCLQCNNEEKKIKKPSAPTFVGLKIIEQLTAQVEGGC